MDPKVFKIPSSNLPTFQAKLAKLIEDLNAIFRELQLGIYGENRTPSKVLERYLYLPQ